MLLIVALVIITAFSALPGFFPYKEHNGTISATNATMFIDQVAKLFQSLNATTD